MDSGIMVAIVIGAGALLAFAFIQHTTGKGSDRRDGGPGESTGGAIGHDGCDSGDGGSGGDGGC